MKRVFKLLSSLMVICLIVSLFSLNSFADSVVSYSLYDFTFVSGTDRPTAFQSLSSDIGTVTRVYYSSTSSVKASGYYKVSDNLLSGTSYTFKVKTKRLTGTGASVLLYLSDTPTEVSASAVQIANINVTSTSWLEYSSQFQFPEKYVNKQVYLVAVISVPAAANQFYVSDFTFTDNNPVTKDGFFDGLIDNIKEFFDYLIDMVLYFEHPVELNSEGVPINTDTGLPVYENPFGNVWEQVQDKLEEWIGDISDFIVSMGDARDNITGYLDSGKTLIDGVVTGVPVISAVLLFVAGFYVIRKVVGQ